MKRLIVDVDETISQKGEDGYTNARLLIAMRDRLKEYKAMGFTIVLCSSRNMQTFESNVGRINAVTLPILVDWLDRNDVPYDEIYMGKPWCGNEGFYIDDKAVRPIEFVTRSYDELRRLLEDAAAEYMAHEDGA